MKKLTFNLHTPCPVDFSKLERTENGSFHCQYCNNDIIDFASMSDGEVINFFLENTRQMGKLCGKLTQRQLENGIMLPEKQFPTKPSLLNKVATATIIGLSVFGTAAESMAQETVNEKEHYTIKKIPSTVNPTDSFTVRVYEIPAEHDLIQTQKMVASGGIDIGWAEICAPPSPHSVPIHKVKAALHERGYYKGEFLDDMIDEQMEQAVANYRRDKELAGNEFRIDEALLKSLGLLPK